METITYRGFEIKISLIPQQSPKGRLFRLSGIEKIGKNKYKYTFRYLDGDMEFFEVIK